MTIITDAMELGTDMEEWSIDPILRDDSHNERAESSNLRKHALDTITSSGNATSLSALPDTLLDLLNQVIKPLFSKDKHSKLTSTGRKNLVDQNLPAALERFSSDYIFDSEKRPLWKNGWTGSLLRYVLHSYGKISDIGSRKKTLDAHFHLLVPPILHQIDDIDIVYKVSGCRCLELLCDNLHDAQSEILKRSGLADVFVEALKNNFSYLPTLTPEDESLMLYQALYPAFRSLVKARFVTVKSLPKPALSTSLIVDLDDVDEPRNAKLAKPEETLRQSYLTLILRHQLLYSLSHLSVGSGGGGTTCISLSTLLVSQFSWIFTDMGLASVVHVQTVLPLLRNILSDPFGTASPDMLLETVRALRVLIQTTWPRIQEKWWGECLRGIVSCWLNVIDDEKDVKDKTRKEALVAIKHELKVTARLLEDIVGEHFVTTSADLKNEEPLLQELLNGKL